VTQKENKAQRNDKTRHSAPQTKTTLLVPQKTVPLPPKSIDIEAGLTDIVVASIDGV
jgi:hypothetical protein